MRLFAYERDSIQSTGIQLIPEENSEQFFMALDYLLTLKVMKYAAQQIVMETKYNETMTQRTVHY